MTGHGIKIIITVMVTTSGTKAPLFDRPALPLFGNLEDIPRPGPWFRRSAILEPGVQPLNIEG
jgi:hypothetical protein